MACGGSTRRAWSTRARTPWASRGSPVAPWAQWRIVRLGGGWLGRTAGVCPRGPAVVPAGSGVDGRLCGPPDPVPRAHRTDVAAHTPGGGGQVRGPGGRGAPAVQVSRGRLPLGPSPPLAGRRGGGCWEHGVGGEPVRDPRRAPAAPERGQALPGEGSSPRAARGGGAGQRTEPGGACGGEPARFSRVAPAGSSRAPGAERGGVCPSPGAAVSGGSPGPDRLARAQADGGCRAVGCLCAQACPSAPPLRTLVWRSGLRWAVAPCGAAGPTAWGRAHDAVRH
jgi:hypothetical protein